MLPMQDLPHVFARIALANGQDVCFTNNDGENVNKKIDSYFRVHMEYKRPAGGLNIYREALVFLVQAMLPEGFPFHQFK